MTENGVTYTHSLPPLHYQQLCALPEVIARYARGSNGTDLLQKIRQDCSELPPDPNQEGNRLLELESGDQDLWLKILEWAAYRSGDERFNTLVQEIRAGTARAA